MDMKNVIKILALTGLMSTALVQATEIPADIEVSHGVLFVHWNAPAEEYAKANPTLEVHDESGGILVAAPATLMGTQQISIPAKSHDLSINLGDSSHSEYHIPSDGNN